MQKGLSGLNAKVTGIILTAILSLSFIWSGKNDFIIKSNTETELAIEFSIDALELKNIDGYTRIETKGGRTMEQGMPELPVYTTFFQLDPGTSYDITFNVLNSHRIQNIQILPVQDSEQDWNPGESISINTGYYSEEVYPESNVTLSEPMIMRDLEVALVSLIPFRYYPGSRELEVFDDVEIVIHETGDRSGNAAPLRPVSRTFEDLYESLVVNYVRTEGIDYQQPAILYICGGGSNGAIIHPAFQQLIQWRHKRGYVVYTATTDETGSSSSAIKNYIQNAYDTFDPAPEFVGLVGDVGGGYNIPTFQESWSGYSGDGDHPYSQLDGTDILPEVLIGRISVSNGTDLAVVVNKTLAYEKALYTGNDWFERAALVGDPSSSGLSTMITNEYIQNIMENFGFEDVRTRLGEGGYPSWMQNQLTEGILYFNYRGWLGTSGFSSSNINAANNGYKTPFVTFITCGTGSFSSTAISESFLRAGTVSNPKGGVAAIGTATSGTHTAFNNIVDMGIYDGIFSKGIETAGGALASGKLALFQTYPSNPSNKVSIFTHWNNLMGDPALHLWTDTPAGLDVTFPETVGLGSNFITVSVVDETGDALEGALVTLVTGLDEIFTSELTDDLGMAVINIDPGMYTGGVDVTVTKRNYQPYEGSLIITGSGPVANVLEEGMEVLDDSGGNGDGQLNPGETVTLRLPVMNFGSEDVSGLTAHLEAGSDKITIMNSVVPLGSLPVGSQVFVDFQITADVSLVYMEELGLVLSLTDANLNQWMHLIHLNVYAPALSLTGYSVVNGGMVTPGTTRELTVNLSNSGALGTTGITAAVTSPSSLIEVVDGYLQFGNASAGSAVSSVNTLVITTSDDIVNGSIYFLEAHISSDDGYDAVDYLRLQVGEVSVTDPLGPDNYGYYIYDSNDLGYSLAPDYNWIEIDPALGGNGISLDMYDQGNGNPVNQQSAYVSLPFTFSFYGVEYDGITVSTNGWIAFGESNLESFRNYSIPGAGGPSPMVAVFWDDMKTTGGGDVLKYINEDEGYVVIEWSNMHTMDQNSPESFQIILYDTLTPTGDGEMILQYKVFNNTSIGNYGGYTPLHGAYCTIGIENQYANDGLQYTFNNQYATAAMELSDETALLITTRQPAAMLMGDSNQDGEVNIQDIVVMISFILNSGDLDPIGQFVSDLNDDGNVNILDVILMINLILDN